MRVLFLKLIIRSKFEPEAVEAALKHFIAAPDDSNTKFFEECKSMNADIKRALAESAITALAYSPEKWSQRESQVFHWITLASEECIDFHLRDSIDLALEREIRNSDNDAIKTACTDTILKLWEQRHGFSKKSFNILTSVMDKPALSF